MSNPHVRYMVQLSFPYFGVINALYVKCSVLYNRAYLECTLVHAKQKVKWSFYCMSFETA